MLLAHIFNFILLFIMENLDTYQRRLMNSPFTHWPALKTVNSWPVFDLIISWLFWSNPRHSFLCKYSDSIVLFAIFWNSEYSVLMDRKILELGRFLRVKIQIQHLIQCKTTPFSFLRGSYPPRYGKLDKLFKNMYLAASCSR